MREGGNACICLSAALLCACAGNGEGLNENGRPIEESQEQLVAELASIQQQVFTPICTGCHSGAAAPLGLRLDEGAAFAMLVGAPSVEVPSLNRVQPGDPDASYLIHKLEGTAAVGARMPLNAPPLPADTIAVIRQWIANGAMPVVATSQLSDTAPAVEATWPIANTRLIVAPKEIVLTSSTELDTTLLAADTVALVYRQPGSATHVRLPTSTTVRTLSPTVFVVTVAQDRWLPGSYALRVSGTSPLALADLNGRAIDGDADGTAGGDLVVSFVLESTP